MIRSRLDYEDEELKGLAGFACSARKSKGRLQQEPEHEYRTVFQRDRDRVVHCRAFRRLEYKTQVFIFHEGDHYRNRLTHTLEASQIARTCARALRGNEDLSEAIVLAHDLGHTPFGHAGEHALAELMEGHGGFDHNRQTLRIVDWLEERYPGIKGLNLPDETRSGIAKHGCDWEHPVELPSQASSPTLEAQIADCSDEIAYLNHDLDDGLRSKILKFEQLEDVTLWVKAREVAEDAFGNLDGRTLASATVIALIDLLSSALIKESGKRIAELPCLVPRDVLDCEKRVVGYPSSLDQERLELREFLFDNLYYHKQVVEMSEKAACIVSELFKVYLSDPTLLPERIHAEFGTIGEPRAIADYLAGMTDRFAQAEHRKLVSGSK